MSEKTPTHYKGIPLKKWVSERLLAMLDEEEMIELHALIYSSIIDEVENYVKRSDMIEADLVIQHIKSKL
jgi:hypothetical protein